MKTLHEQVGDKCVHFTGYQKGFCNAGVNYRVLVGGPDFGWAARLPCIKNTFLSKGPRCECPSRRWPTDDEIKKEVEELETMIRPYLKTKNPAQGVE